jgi:hypothetical protein
VLRGRRASSTPLIEDQPEVGNGVAKQVEVGLELVQTLRLKLPKQPLWLCRREATPDVDQRRRHLVPPRGSCR